jgi:hypothetical protein
MELKSILDIALLVLAVWLGSLEFRLRSKVNKDFCEARKELLELIVNRLDSVEGFLRGGKR